MSGLDPGGETAWEEGPDGLMLCVRGDGPAICWVHAYTLDSSVWFDLWDRLPGWRHVGIDLPGHGRSRPMHPAERLVQLGESIAEVASAHRARHLVGLSFGSMVALQAAIAAPSTFASLVVAAPAVAGAPTDPAAAVRYEQLRILHGGHGPGPLMTELWMSSPPNIFRGAQGHPALWEQLRRLIDKHRWAELDGATMATFAAAAQTEQLTTVAAHTLVILGEHEMEAHRHAARLVAEHVPHPSIKLIAGAGHLCLLEAPDVCAPLIDAHARLAAINSSSS